MNVVMPGEYNHSGRVGTAPLIVPLGGLIAAFVLSIVYSYVIVYVPIAGYISIVFVGALVFGLAWTISKLGYVSHCRNSAFMHLMGLFLGLVSLYVAWATFVYALLSKEVDGFEASLLDVLLSPLGVWEYAKLINENGWYEMFGVVPSGIGLWTIWGIEAALIVGGAALLAGMHIDNGVYCEDCGGWCQRSENAARLQVPDNPDSLRLRPDDVQPLLSLEPASVSAAGFVRVDTWQCSDCSTTAAMQVKLVTINTDDKGETSESVDDLTPIWTVSHETVKQVTTAGVG